MPLAVGAKLGPYEVIDLVGAGGMGEVYRAHDPRLGRDVAVKVLPASVAADPARLRRFEREARAAASLNHPNVLTVYDVGLDESGVTYVVSELLEGVTLRQAERQRRLSRRQVVELGIQLAQGLDAAHRRGLVHRDVKPENVFLTSDGRAKILDFGIAKLEDAAESVGTTAEAQTTAAGSVLGTVAYMSPEQARSLPVDHRSDVFSLGVVLYELLSGRHPFARETPTATVAAIVSDAPPALASLARGVSPTLASLVHRCLEKDPERRFRSAHDLALSLEAALQPSSAPSVEPEEEHGPYPGLSSFTERDAGFFFGREAEVRSLWAAVRENPLLGVIGPSGAGKTSFVRAGVVASRPTGWSAVACTPGAAPLRALGRALAPELQSDSGAVVLLVNVDDPDTAFDLVRRWREAHAEALLVLDQFEELFTLCSPQTRARFAALVGRLCREADVHVLLSLRDDFLIRCCEWPELAPVLSSLASVLPLKGEDLRRALVEPAARLGYRFEDEALVEEMVVAVAGERAPLPLLAFAVSRLWEERDAERKLLTRAAYERIGGVAGALAQHAEATLEGIGAERQPIARELFRNLVTSHGTRAVAETGELLSAFADRDAARSVLDALVNARLLTAYEPTAGESAGRAASPGQGRVEIVHESLLAAWPRLVQWQAQDQDGAILRDQLKQAAHLWLEKGRPPDLLWSGTSFREYELWRSRYPGALTATEEAFARAMTARARRRRRVLRAGVGVAFAALAAVVVVVGASRREAVRSARIADEQTHRARASRLVALGRLELDRYPTAAVAYARRSLEMADTIEARMLALEALWRGPVVRIFPDRATDCSRLAWSADDRLVACSGFTPEVEVLSSEGAFGGFALQPTMADARSTLPFGAPPGLLSWLPGDDRVRELTLDGRERRSYPGEVHLLRVLPDGDFVTCGPVGPGARELVIRRWAPGGSAPRELGRWTPPAGMRFDQPGVRPLDVDPLLRWLSYGWESGVHVRALGSSHGPVEALVGRHPGRLREVTFDPAGARLASLDETGVVKVWSMPDRKELRSLPAVPAARFSMLSFDAAGRRLAWGTGGEGVLVWDLEAPPDAPPLRLRQGETAHGRQHAFSGDGQWLAGGGLGTVNFWALGQPHARVLRGHAEGPLERLAFTGDSRFLVSCARDGARLWPLTPDGGREHLIPIGGDYMCYDLGIDPAGRGVALSSPFMGIYLVPLDGGQPRRLVNLSGRRLAVTAIAFDAGGRRLVVGSCYAPPASELSLFVVDLRSGSYRTLPLRRGVPENPYTGHVDDAAFSPQGRLLTAGDGGIKRWNLENGTAEVVRGRPGRFGALAASGDRRRVLALLGRNVGDFLALDDPEAVLLDADTGESRPVSARLHGTRPTHALALDASGERLAIGDVSGAVRVARVSAGEPHLLLGHDAPVTDVAISPDGRWVASAAGSEIRLWPMPDVSKPPLHALPHDELLARLRALTNLEVAEDPTSATGYGMRIGPFPGWRDAPAW